MTIARPLLIGCLSVACSQAPNPALVARKQTVSRVHAAVAQELAYRQDLRCGSQAANAGPRALAQPDDRDWLFSAEVINQVGQALADVPKADERRDLHRMWVFLVEQHIQQGTAALRKELDATLAPARFAQALRTEPEAKRRKTLAESQAAARQDAAPLAEEHRRLLEGIAHSLGSFTYSHLRGRLLAEPMDTVSSLAHRVLRESQPLYRAALDDLGPALTGVATPENIRPGDLAYLVGQSAPPPGIAPFTAAAKTLGTLGVLPPGGVAPAQTRTGQTGAPCKPLEADRALRLPLPAEARADYGQALGAVGSAMALYYGGSTLSGAAQLEDPIPTTTWGYVFARLAHNPDWLTEVLGLSLPEVRKRRRIAAVAELFELRALAGWVLYENTRAEHSKAAAGIMERAYGCPLGPGGTQGWPVQLGPAINALLGRIVAAQIEAHLKQRFGGTWWKNPQAGVFLQETWKASRGATVTEIATSLGLGELSPRPNIAHSAFILAQPAVPQN